LLNTAAALKVELPYIDSIPLDKDAFGKLWKEIQGRISPEESSQITNLLDWKI